MWMQLIQQLVDFGVARVFEAKVWYVWMNHLFHLFKPSRLSIELMHNMVHAAVQYISKWGCRLHRCHFRSGEMEAQKFYQFWSRSPLKHSWRTKRTINTKYATGTRSNQEINCLYAYILSGYAVAVGVARRTVRCATSTTRNARRFV